MATGLQRLVRRKVLALLKADSELTGLVPAARIYSQAAAADPAWPFIKLGAPTTLRLRAAGVNGGAVSFDVHAFARARESGGQEVETAEDHCGRIGAQIERVLADNRIALDGGEIVKLALSDMQLLQDEDPGAFHYLCQVNARVLAA